MRIQGQSNGQELKSYKSKIMSKNLGQCTSKNAESNRPT